MKEDIPMGGGRDKDGAPLYKRVNGKYIRVVPYKDVDRTFTSDISDNYFKNKVHYARSKEQLLDIMRKKYGEHNVPKSFVYKNNINMVKRAVETVIGLEQQFPEMKGFVKAWGNTTQSPAAAFEFDGIMRLGRYWGHEDEIELYSDSLDHTGDYANRTPESVIAHEFQHAMQAKLLQMMYPSEFVNGEHKHTSDDMYFKLNEAWESGNFLEGIKNKALQKLGMPDSMNTYGQISLYATESIFEAFAEGFADVYANDNEANRVSKALTEAFLEEYNNYGGK